jgi:hypothetical protein
MVHVKDGSHCNNTTMIVKLLTRAMFFSRNQMINVLTDQHIVYKFKIIVSVSLY